MIIIQKFPPRERFIKIKTIIHLCYDAIWLKCINDMKIDKCDKIYQCDENWYTWWELIDMMKGNKSYKLELSRAKLSTVGLSFLKLCYTKIKC